MQPGALTTPAEEFFATSPLGKRLYENVRAILEGLGPVEVRISKSQVAFRRAKGFAYIWLPGRYLARPGAEVVLSMALGRRVSSPRFKQVIRPPSGPWMHHLEIHDVDDLDDEVAGWLAEAAERADYLPANEPDHR